jgi:hypothetical protein
MVAALMHTPKLQARLVVSGKLRLSLDNRLVRQNLVIRSQGGASK